MNIYIPIILFIVITLIVFFKVQLREGQKFPYRKKDYLLTITEKEFYNTLKQVVDKNNLLIFSKVRLEDLLWLPKGIDHKERFSLRNRIKSRHVDFVICDNQNIKPLLVIELDDSSHDKQSRINRDGFIDNVLDNAGLPILHQKVQNFYNLREIETNISQFCNIHIKQEPPHN